jgi:class 3 adenylate cyclase/GAF domain-containing protein
MPTTIAPTDALSTLHDLAQLLSSSVEPAVMLERVMDAAISATGAERGFLLLDRDGKALQVEVARNFQKEDLKDPTFNASHTVIDFVSETGTSQLIDDALTDSRTAASESIVAQHLRSIVCVPIRAHDRTVGVLYLDHRGETAHFGRPELQLLEVIVQQAAVALERGLLRVKSRGDGESAEELKAFREAILNGLSTAVLTMDAQGRVLSINPAARDLFQVGDDAIRRSFRAVLGEAVGGQLLEAFKAAVAGRATSAIPMETKIDETPRFLRCSVSPLRDGSGQPAGIVLLVDDDTAKVLAERARDREAAEHKRIRELFSKYVPEAVVDKVLDGSGQGQGRAGVVEREVSVLFADIRGYTTLSERSTPDRLLVTLTRYLTVATNSVLEQNGTLDKFMGDGVMAVFNAPTDLPDHPLAAVRAAWAMQRRAARFMEGVSFGVGVNTGQAFVGNIGTEKIRNYSCVGDVVNVASRLQGHAEGGHIIITRSTYNRVKDHVRVKGLGPVQVKGRAMPVEAIQVLAVHGEMDS